MDIKWNPESKQYEVLFQWAGFEVVESTWQALSLAYADAPDLINDYVAGLEESMLKRKIVKALEKIVSDIEGGKVPKKKKKK